MEPDEVQRVGGFIIILDGFKALQRMQAVIEGDLNVVVNLLLPIWRLRKRICLKNIAEKKKQ